MSQSYIVGCDAYIAQHINRKESGIMDNIVRPNNAPVSGLNPSMATAVRKGTKLAATSKVSNGVTPNIVQATGQNSPNVPKSPSPNNNNNMPKSAAVQSAYQTAKSTLGTPSAFASPTVGVRDYAVGKDVDNNSIGWDGKNVTIGSKSVTPKYVTEDGVAYGSQSDIDNAIAYLQNENHINQNNLQPVRSSLVAAGIPDNQIGYNADTGYVTAYGKDLFKPSVNNDGTTYATEGDLKNAYHKAYQNNGDDLVAVRDYVSQQGYGGAVDWDGEKVTVGGRVVPYAYIEDGTAYVSRAAAENALSGLRDSAGIEKAEDVRTDNYDRYGAAYDRLLDKMDNYGDFHYDLENDTEFQNHSKYMQDLAEDAYRSVLEKYNTSTDGATGAQLAEANSSLNSYLAQLADDATAYRDKAYDRYTDGYNRLANNLNAYMNVGGNDYNMAYNQMRDAVSDRRNAASDEFSRIQYEDGKPDTDLNRALAAAQIEGYGLDNVGRGLQNSAQEVSNQSAAAQYAMEQASNRNVFLPEDEAYLPWLKHFRNEDGTYSITPWSAEAQYIYDTAVQQYKAQYDTLKEYGLLGV